MKLWIATDGTPEEPGDTWLFSEQPSKDNINEWNRTTENGRCAFLGDQTSDEEWFIKYWWKSFPPPGECWEFDVEFRRVK